jgi:rhodanese-related sulfurtransferase
MKKIFILFLVLLTTIVSATTPQDAYKMYLNKQAYIVDVREIEEIQNGMIDGAMWFPRSQMLTDKKLLADFKTLTLKKKVFLYCQKGKRAGECHNFLKGQKVDSENLGGYDELKEVLPTKSLTEQLNRENECKVQ